MGAIDVGSGATDRANTFSFLVEYTLIDKANPANSAGTLTSFEIWAESNMAGVKVGVFSGSGTSYDDRDYETIGAVTAGSKQTFSGLDCDVVTGDFIGIHADSGALEYVFTGGTAVYYVVGDKFGSGSATYTLLGSGEVSIYATGATAGWANIGKINGVASADIAKVNGVAVADISKVDGVAV